VKCSPNMAKSMSQNEKLTAITSVKPWAEFPCKNDWALFPSLFVLSTFPAVFAIEHGSLID